MSLNRRRKDTSAWLEKTNPLAGLSLRQAQSVYDAARGKGSALLQRIYAEIEAADPVLMTCVERRGSALAGLGWRAVADSDAADAVLADEQKDFITRLAAGIGNFTEAVEHLDLAFFRGYSHVQPVWEGGAVRRVVTLDSWNFLREGGRWFWNPDCRGGTEGLEEVTDAMRLVTVTRPRAIDYPAMSIHIRKALGERDWGRFTERYGLPPVDAVMGEGATDEQRAEYLEAAEAARDGLPVVWPSGAQVSRAEGARGQDPFSAFIEHQEKLVVLMATGGTLTSLAQADTGALAGGAQMDVWEQIVKRDAAIIGDALDRCLFRPALEAAFPGKAAAAHFELGRDDEPDAGELFDLAAKARTAGYRVERTELEEASGYTLVEDAPARPGGFGGFGNAQTPLQFHAKALQNARKPSGATSVPPEAETRLEAILDDFAEKLGEEMLGEMALKSAGALRGEGGDEVENSTDANGAEHAEAGSGNGGQFVSKDGGSKSEAVRKLTEGEPGFVTPEDADAALEEGFEVESPEGRVRFGKELADHLSGGGHAAKDAAARKARLAFAVDTVAHPDEVEKSHRGDGRQTAYKKSFEEFGIMAVTGRDSESIEYVFTFFPDRKRRKQVWEGAGRPANPAATGAGPNSPLDL